MDGRQIHHVESHRGDPRQLRRGGGEGAVPGCAVLVPAARRAGKEFVPGTEQCPFPVDDGGVCLPAGDQLAQGIGPQDLGDVGGEGGRDPVGQRPLRTQRRGDGEQGRPVGARRGLGGLLEQPGADLDVVRQVFRALPGGDLRVHRVPPRGDRVAPGLDAVGPQSRTGGGEYGVEGVGCFAGNHRNPDQLSLAFRVRARPAHGQGGGDGVVTLAPHDRRHGKHLPDDGLDRMSPARDVGTDIVDAEPSCCAGSDSTCHARSVPSVTLAPFPCTDC